MEENDHNAHDHRHSNHGEVGFCLDNHHDAGCILGMVHDDRSHQDEVGEQEIVIELGREECPVGSEDVSGCQGWGSDNTNISNACNSNALKLAAIQLLYCGLEIRSSLEFDEASELVSSCMI